MSPSWLQAERSRITSTSRSARSAGSTWVPKCSNSVPSGSRKSYRGGVRLAFTTRTSFPFCAEQPGHADLRAERVAVGPDVGGHEEAVVRLDQVGQRSPVDAHVDFPRAGGLSAILASHPPDPQPERHDADAAR